MTNKKPPPYKKEDGSELIFLIIQQGIIKIYGTTRNSNPSLFGNVGVLER